MLAIVLAGLLGAPPPAAGDPPLDAAVVFGQLARRYRDLTVYRDTTTAVEVIEPAEGEPRRTETTFVCDLRDGKLRIITPGSQLRKEVGIDKPESGAAGKGDKGGMDGMDKLVHRYNLWLAPHMALHFAREPLADFRQGVPEGFRPARAQWVTLEERRFVKLDLVAGSPPEADPAGTASFNLWINPRSVLIERLEGRQNLPDGTTQHIVLEIRPDAEMTAGQGAGRPGETR